MQNPWGITKKNKTARHPESTRCAQFLRLASGIETNAARSER